MKLNFPQSFFVNIPSIASIFKHSYNQFGKTRDKNKMLEAGKIRSTSSTSSTARTRASKLNKLARAFILKCTSLKQEEQRKERRCFYTL